MLNKRAGSLIKKSFYCSAIIEYVHCRVETKVLELQGLTGNPRPRPEIRGGDGAGTAIWPGGFQGLSPISPPKFGAGRGQNLFSPAGTGRGEERV